MSGRTARPRPLANGLWIVRENHPMVGILLEPPPGRIDAHPWNQEHVRIHGNQTIRDLVKRGEVESILLPDLGNAIRDEVHARILGLRRRGVERVHRLAAQGNRRMDAIWRDRIAGRSDPGGALLAFCLKKELVPGSPAEGVVTCVEMVIGILLAKPPRVKLDSTDSILDLVHIVVFRGPDLPHVRERLRRVEGGLEAGLEPGSIFRDHEVPHGDLSAVRFVEPQMNRTTGCIRNRREWQTEFCPPPLLEGARH